MNKNKRSAVTVLSIGVMAFALAGCMKEEGPAEKAGKEIDKTLSQAGQQIQKAGDKIQDAARDAQR
ncbi:hypothetical protein EKL30_05920 [Candidimonas sp. SYP-B2681]|uniref:hypothetical protein n=1 Tax=Candidimonas sp. SYP-B2681 TaxID=2497686 RepID=UPI000F85FB69|nr:hypothetical protein [Candidimonas sp. SYP-B2681]RTZ45560.1 hypothetical protein EKL30_05920 [Candidimonas sp. SYP-B2681]